MAAHWAHRQLLAAPRNAFGRDDAFAAAGLDGLKNPNQRMLSQQLQHANKMPSARQRTVTRYKTFTQLRKRRRQTPVAVDGRVIEIGWLEPERGQIVQRIEHLFALAIRAIVPGHEHSVADDFDAIDVGFYGDRGEGMPPRHAVAILLPGDCLVFVDLTDFADRGFERAMRQRQGAGPLSGEACANRFTLAGNRSLAVALATIEQVGIQLCQILHSWDGRRPPALEQLHPVLDVRLFVTAGRQAE